MKLKYHLTYTESPFRMLFIETYPTVRSSLIVDILHPLDSLIHLLKCIILIGLELAHRTMIGVDRDLFFVTNLEKSRMLLYSLNLS